MESLHGRLIREHKFDIFIYWLLTARGTLKLSLFTV